MKSKNLKSILKRTVSFVTASAMMIGMSVVFPEPELEVSAAGDVTVTLSEEHQTIVGFGGINHPEWAGDLTEAQRATAFGNGDGQLGFTVLRVFVNPDKNQWNKALPTAQYASKAGATVFASPWEPPSNLAESGGNNGKLHLPKSNYAAYAQHLNDFGSYMKNNGVDLYSISVQNEPDYAHDWTYWSTDEATDFLANYADKITSTKVMSPESFQYSPDGASWIAGGDGGKRYYKKILNNAKAFANCDVFGTHFYGTTRDWMDFPELEQCGKQIWMTEVYVPDSKIDADKWPDSLELATNMHNGLVIGNMSAYVIWYIRRSYGALKENGQISKRGYMMAQFSKYIRPGYVRVGATEQPEKDLYVSAYKGGGDKVVIVAVNSTTTEYNKNFTIKGASIKDVDRYRSSGSENLVATLDMKSDGDTFNAQLPAQSVSTFVVTVADGSGIPEAGDDPFQEEKPAEPDANGYYFHDTFEGSTDGWAAHGGSTVETSGRNPYKGEEALLVQDRQKAWNGAEKSLSTVTFEPGKEYSFSADVVYLDSDSSSQNIYMKLQYTDSSGETNYNSIAEATAVKGQYVQLANTNYKIPEGASNLKLYIETEEGTDNFYVDEAIGAVAGTKIEGPAAVVLSEKGDITGDGSISVLDVAALKAGLIKGFASAAASIAADVDESGKADIADLLLMKKYVLGLINEFPKAEPVIDVAAMEAAFANVKPGASYKKTTENNSLITQYFGADPGILVYDDRVYVYMTDDALIYDGNSVTDNVYSKISRLRCISSSDLVNWTDHGLINAVGQNGIAKWAGNSWAPTACHKKIDGKEKFFLYFANNANGIGVLTSDSPTGPWTDPNGKALIDRKTATCDSVTWVFDPAVLVDDDGTGYLYFGGGVPEGQNPSPKTARVVKLADNMTSLAGSPQVIDAPYMFEDSGINKIGDKYYYSYCTNWSTGGNTYGLSTAAIDYMTSDSPMGPFTYTGEVFKNIGNFFGTTGNNHHTIFEFKGNYYLAYHTQKLQDLMGIKGGYRSTHIDSVSVSGGKIGSVTGTMTGVSQVGTLDPYKTVQAETIYRQSGIEITGSGDTKVTGITSGDWFGVKGAAFTNGASQIKMNVSSPKGGAIKICTGSETGKAVGYVEVPATNGSYKEVTAPVSGLSGTQDIYFVFNADISVDSWSFS